ncbi:MAG: hypothetical protein HF973_12155 [Chloroflexi bacterium]|nr:hypothetical protein [Chloroflexota bacterium]
MASEITLTLPEHLIKSAQRMGTITHRDTAEVLSDSLEMMWLTLDDVPGTTQPPVADLPDQEVLELADMKMASAQNERLHYLQEKGKESSLTEAERYELLTLLHIYQIGQLRKSEALAEAVRRGLRPPLAG